MVIVERFPDNMGNIFLGKGSSLGIANGIFALVIVIAVPIWATRGFTQKARSHSK